MSLDLCEPPVTASTHPPVDTEAPKIKSANVLSCQYILIRYFSREVCFSQISSGGNTVL